MAERSTSTDRTILKEIFPAIIGEGRVHLKIHRTGTIYQLVPKHVPYFAFQVDAFVAKNEDFAELVGACNICLDPLLNNIGTTEFGVLSWHCCRCTVAQKADSVCVFSKLCHGQGTCDMCHSPMLFEKVRRRGLETTIRFHRDATRSDEGDVSTDSSLHA